MLIFFISQQVSNSNARYISWRNQFTVQKASWLYRELGFPICQLPKWSHRCSGKNSQKRRAKFSLILFTEQRYVGRELTKQKFESFIPMYLTFNFEETEGLTIQILTVGIHCILLCIVPNASWQWVCFWLVLPWRFCLQLFRVIWLFAFYWERTTNRAFWFCFSSLI